jgi:hypothetical protein
MLMANMDKFHMHFSALITHARLKNGFATLKELYRVKNPPINYNTWVHAESGRRVPTTKVVMMIGEILDINEESLLMAYCKDKFDKPQYHQALDSFQHNQFVDVNAFLQAKDHERSHDFVFTTEEVEAIKRDTRLWLYLIYTYDRNLKTTFDRLASFFHVDKAEVKKVITTLESLHLVEVIGEEVKRIPRHTTLPKIPELFDARKDILINGLKLNINQDSVIGNYHINITEDSYRRILSFFDFIEANLIKIDKEDYNKMNSERFQVTITSTRLIEGSNHEVKEQCIDRQS